MGVGTWLKSVSLPGIKDIFGVDGNFIDMNLLEKKFIDKKKFFKLTNVFPSANEI